MCVLHTFVHLGIIHERYKNYWLTLICKYGPRPGRYILCCWPPRPDNHGEVSPALKFKIQHRDFTPSSAYCILSASTNTCTQPCVVVFMYGIWEYTLLQYREMHSTTLLFYQSKHHRNPQALLQCGQPRTLYFLNQTEVTTEYILMDLMNSIAQTISASKVGYCCRSCWMLLCKICEVVHLIHSAPN